MHTIACQDDAPLQQILRKDVLKGSRLSAEPDKMCLVQVTDGKRVLEVSSGVAMLQQITASGCTVTALIAAFVACALKEPLLAAAHALSAFGCAAPPNSEVTDHAASTGNVRCTESNVPQGFAFTRPFAATTTSIIVMQTVHSITTQRVYLLHQ